MLDINYIRQNPGKVKEACVNKQVKVDVDKILEIDKRLSEAKRIQEGLNAIKNERNKTMHGVRDKATILGNIQGTMVIINKYLEDNKTTEEEVSTDVKELEKQRNELLMQLPCIPFDEVPIGKDDSENVILRKSGSPVKFSFKGRDYMDLGESLKLIDTERAGKVAGSRFGYLKGQLPLLEFALVKLVMDTVQKEGFIPVIPPVMLKDQMARGTGYFEATDEKEAYYLPEDKMYLVGTSEQSLIAMHADEVLSEKDLPLRYVAFSTCFRREAGSYGKDTKGILRVHQFDKLEMVVFSKPESSRDEHKLLLATEEKLMKALKLPYQVVNICTGDLGRPAAAKYDIEAWLPSENKYRETHSTSNCTDFQARRLNIRYRDKAGKVSFVHTLNGTAFAIGRILIMIMENYQQKDGSIKVPAVLQKFAGIKVIRPQK